jgi:flagellar hook-associated protein 1 FlgK
MSIFSVGTGALNAAQTGILTTGHNISNASTPGYNRQEIVQSTNLPNLTGSGYIGSGTNVQTVKRIYDQFLGQQILSAEAGAAEMDSYLVQVQQMDNLFADPDAGLSPALASFFKGVQEVAANPASIPGRQSMLSAAQTLVSRFQGIDQRMREVRDGLNSQVFGQVESINTYATQLAEINQRIILAESGSLNQKPNDLYDQREQMVRDLNKVVRVSTVTQSDGSFNVFIGNGQPLVIGSQAYSLAAVADNSDPERVTVGMNGVGGTLLTLPESQVSGGSLGGLLSFRSGSLDDAQNALGRIAVSLAQNFNDQHQLGMDLTGALGGEFFVLADPVQKPSALNAPNTGQPAISIDPATLSQLSGSDYQIFSTDGATFQLRRLSDNTLTSITSVPQVVDGMSIDTTNWHPGAGDSILIQPTRAGARNIAVAVTDPRAIAAAAPVRTSAALTNTGSAAIDSGRVVDTQGIGFGSFSTTGELAPPLLIKFDSPATSPMTYSVYDKTAYDLDPTVTPLEANIAYTAGAEVFPTPGLLDYGYRIKFTGAPAAGDIFTVSGNKNGVADNRNAMLLGALQTASTMLGGATYGPTATYQSAYSQIVSAVGSKTAEIKTIGAAQQGLADHAITSLQEISGVNLDEEAANLLRYQQAYQAAAKILEIAGRVFDEVIALGR